MLVPDGQAVRKLPAVGLVTVTFSTTAVGGVEAVIRGTPPCPATVTAIVCPAPSGLEKPPVPFRVSRMRAGVSPVNVLPVAVELLASVNQPPTSAITCTVPK